MIAKATLREAALWEQSICLECGVLVEAGEEDLAHEGQCGGEVVPARLILQILDAVEEEG